MCLVPDVQDQNKGGVRSDGTHLDSVSGTCPEKDAQGGHLGMQVSTSQVLTGSH